MTWDPARVEMPTLREIELELALANLGWEGLSYGQIDTNPLPPSAPRNRSGAPTCRSTKVTKPARRG